MEIAKTLGKYIPPVEQRIMEWIDGAAVAETLHKSMRYSMEAGGKRMRPSLLLATIESLGGNIDKGLDAAAAIEMVHTYSLIHDDLPSMDNDSLRRGKPTNHVVFGEATAILAGDALLTLAFQAIAHSTTLTNQQKVHLIGDLSSHAGSKGMVGGQMLDMEGEKQSLPLEKLQQVHELKTGKLLTFSIVAGAKIAEASEDTIKKLENFSYHLGIAFQIKDDILDVEGLEEVIGKSVGKDQSTEKSTYPSLLTLQGAKQKLQFHIRQAAELLEDYSGDNQVLLQLVEWVEKRDR
ncbi:polyprenyl synthetase family protein [Mangrovibacillus cuniculi]|uniref:Farnesyl diphosphate synthase n=1 Tax=Mangrovibacillus cuniculi TaxID=2593652 RepID=A0A7S8HFE4_9BACI|nr:farnesyl diphosphate synthase [Mangrovibacillus cuniculi]QPC46819.1 polyprenyl synthetase family protein [Mangrovibacillus cuniculi]